MRGAIGCQLNAWLVKIEEIKGMAEYHPLVSIITATYNPGAMLAKTQKSIEAQKHLDVEWVIVDGGSTDGTVDFLKNCRIKSFKWISEPDAGIYDAWNKGIAIAQGEWVIFMGAGDLISEDGISICLGEIAKENSLPNLVTSQTRLVDCCGRVRRIMGAPFELAKFEKNMNIAHVGALHHKSLFIKYGKFDVNYKIAGAYQFLLRCRRGIKSIYIPIVGADMLIGGVSDKYAAIFEAHMVRARHCARDPYASFRLAVAIIKRFIRPLTRGY